MEYPDLADLGGGVETRGAPGLLLAGSACLGNSARNETAENENVEQTCSNCKIFGSPVDVDD